MNPFSYERATDAASAIRLANATAATRYLGGGTNLVDLMREHIEQPEVLVDVTPLAQSIEVRADGSMLIGAAVKNTALASDAHVRQAFPLLSRAILAGASAQIRNMATVAGNILQRTRCTYFFMTRPRAATSASPAVAAMRCRGLIAITPSWARRMTAWPRIRRTCAWLWRRWMPSCICKALRAAAACR